MCNVGGLASGGYSCVAENGLSTSNATFEVTIPASIQLFSGPTMSSARVGSTHNMSCDFHSFPRPYVTWSGVPLSAAGRFNVQETIERREGVEFVRSVLSISPVADYDGGEIACVGTNGQQELKHSFQLEVLAPPQIVVSPGHTHTAISDAHTTLTLACIAHSSSHIYWTRNDLEISTDDRRSVASDLVTRGGRSFVRGVLKVCGVGVTDSGEYSCVASGDGETTTATFDLCAVESTGILVAPSDVTIETGHTLSVGCVGYTTVSNAPSTNLSWTFDDQPLGNSSKVTVLEHRQENRNVVLIRATLLVNCIKPENAARYGCHVTSLDTVVKSADFNILVHTPPLIKDAPNSTQSVLKDGTISFTCVASGVPLPTILWYKDGSPLITDVEGRLEIIQTNVDGFGDFDRAIESVLTIQSVGEGDAGYYGCKAGSTAGETELTNQYHLILSPILVTPGGLETPGGLGHGSYVGGIVGALCFLAIMVVYIVIKPLREEPFTPVLTNACVSVIALNLAYVISHNTTRTGTGCIFFAALFHYLFLVAMLALTNLVMFKAITVTGKRRLFAHVIAFCLNWGIPLLVVAVSIGPDITNYTPNDTTHFCGPTQWPYWLGELLPLGLLHLLTWCVFLVTSLLNRTKNGLTEWAWHFTSTGSTLFLFDITWSVGLPSTQHTDTALHSVFLVSSILFGLVSLIFYCLAYRKARLAIIKIFKLSPSSTVSVKSAVPAEQLEAMFQDRAFSVSGIEAGKLVQLSLSQNEVPSREKITSFADSIAKEDFDLSLSQEENGDVFPSGAETEAIGQSEDPITSFCEPPLEENKLDLAVAEPTVSEPSVAEPSTNGHQIQPAEPRYMTTIHEPTQPRYVTANHVDCNQDDDVFATDEDVRVQEKVPLSRALMLSTSSSEGGCRTNGGYRPLRQGSVTGPQIVRFALV
ncbi:uncharacterized protein LOC135339656 isoform X2 [Halichondria panicea]